MVQTLDIFEHRFGDEAHPGWLDAGEGNTLGEAGLRMLDAIQTVVDVLADDVNKGYSVGFANAVSAYTEHGKKRITISGLPLTKAKAGTPYRDIAAILTGFAVHEVGHTKRIGIIDAVRKEWPGKQLPGTLANVIEDVVLEARTIERFAGFKHVFEPTFEYVARETCPTHPIPYRGSSGHKVNFVGQVVRYRDFVTFAGDAYTQQELLWWDEWAARITARTDGPAAVKLVREAIEHIAEPEPESESEPGEGEPEPGDGEPSDDGEPNDGPTQPGLPDEEDEDDDTEGDDGDGDSEESDEEGGSEGGDTEGDSEDGESNGGGTEGDDTEGGDSDSDGNPEGGDEDGGNAGDGLDADTEHRLDGDKGSTDSDGAGGSGQTVAEASDPADPDDWDENELDKSFDDLAETKNSPADRVLEQAIAEERTTTRLDAGAHGKMRVIFR